MPINVSEAITSDTAEIVTVKRVTPGSYVEGLFVPGSESTFKTVCSVQQPSPKMLENLASGIRKTDVMVFYSKKKIRTGDERDGTSPDIILYRGNEYRVIQEAVWVAYGYYNVMGVRIV